MKPTLLTLRDTASTFWAARDARERALLGGAAVFIAGVLYYLLLIAPASAARVRLNLELPQLHQSVAQMQALSAQAHALNDSTGMPVSAMSRESLATALGAHGLKPLNLTVEGGTARLQLQHASYAQLLACLDELQQGAHISVSDAKIEVVQGDQVDAALTLEQAGSH